MNPREPNSAHSFTEGADISSTGPIMTAATKPEAVKAWAIVKGDEVMEVQLSEKAAEDAIREWFGETHRVIPVRIVPEGE